MTTNLAETQAREKSRVPLIFAVLATVAAIIDFAGPSPRWIAYMFGFVAVVAWIRVAVLSRKRERDA